MEDDLKLRDAKRHVEALKGFYIHGIVFALVMTGLFIINFAVGPPWWVQWPFLGWGIGILGHAAAVFSPMKFFGTEWEERKIKQLMEKTQSKQ